MKGKIAAILCLLILPLISLALIAPAKAADGARWVEPAYVGLDVYYHTNIVGYLTGTNWNFTFSWTNGGSNPINVTALRMYFTWGKNYSSTYTTPLVVAAGATQIFNLMNMTPTLAEAPEQIGPFSYTVYVHHANNTVAPYNDMVIERASGDNFAVLSADHLACLNLWAKYAMFFGDGPLMMLPQGGTFPFGANITEAQILFTRAVFELEQGMRIFEAGGGFGAAKTHLQTGDTYFSNALTAWNDRGTAIEDADLAYKEAQTTYYTALGDANKMNAYGWILFGLGWMFIGLGIIIYAFRKPKVVQS